MPSSSRVIALFGHTSLEQHFLEGVRRFWADNPGLEGTVYRTLEELEGDNASVGGIIAYIPSERKLEALRAQGCPLVNTSNRFLAGKLPSVVVDDEEVGRVAGEHLLERGYRSIHFVAHPDADFSRQRESGLRAVCEAVGVPVEVHMFPGLAAHMEPTDFIQSLFGLGEIFLQGDLSRRAVMFYADSAAYSFLAAATPRFGVRLMQLAFMGVDAMEPPDSAMFRLTSVRPDFLTVGIEAASLIGRLQRGETPPNEAIRIRNAQLVAGETTPPVEA